MLEGFLSPDTLPEGPFGEFTGYYAADKRPAPVMNIAAMHCGTIRFCSARRR